MGAKTKAVGGGSAKGVSKDFLAFLRSSLYNPIEASPNSVAGAINRFLAGPDSATIESIRQLQERQKAEDLANIKAQFGLTTSSSGGGGASAVARYLAEANPRNQLAIQEYINEQQLRALNALLPFFGQAVGLGTPQRQIVSTPSFGANLFNTLIGGTEAFADVYRALTGRK